MRVAVFGTGGVGGYFGGKLAQAGEEVIFLARGGHLEAIRKNGLQVESILGDFTVHPAQATSDPVKAGPVDVVLLGVKAWQVSDAAAAMRPLLRSDTIVIPLQNGVGAPAQLSAVLGPQGVLGGLCKISALVAAPGVIRHLALEPYIAFGELDGRPNALAHNLCEAFLRSGVRAEVPADIQAAMWEKFLFIAAFSGLSAVTRSAVGALRSQPELWSMLERAMEEIYCVARARQINLPQDVVARTLAFVQGLPAGATPSMTRDVLEGKRSELDYQNGAVVRMGLEAGIPVPVNTFVYYSLLPQEMKRRGELNG